MIIKKHIFHEEVWGAKVPLEEIEINESYENEVFELVAEKIEKCEIEVIPDELDVEDDYTGKEAIIYPYDYLSEKQIAELEKMIEKKVRGL